MPLELKLSLFSNTPVVECELNPIAYVRSTDNNPTEIPKYTLQFNWYKRREKIFGCHVHPHEVATIQCMVCVESNVPVEETYHCTSECLLVNWPKHRDRHKPATLDNSKIGEDHPSRELRTFGSWAAFPSSSESNGTATLVERGGESWTKICSSKTYVPSKDDFGYRLKLVSLAVDHDGHPLNLTHFIETDHVIFAPVPPLRRMISVESGGFLRNVCLETQPHLRETFSILSYNVLAAYSVNREHYSYCPAWALTWPYRRRNLLHEIIRYNADILCLQEVQKDHFENFFGPELAKCGYAVIYKKKISELLTGEYKYTTDGCATFFRANKFKEILKSELEFRPIAQMVYERLSPTEQTQECVHLVKDNVAVIVILEAKESGAVFCVANTHIHANQQSRDAKIWQVATLINELEKITEQKIPVLICGDLNALPGSAPHDLLATGSVNFDHEELKETPVAMFKHLTLSHRMHLVSAYSSMLRNTSGFSISEEQRKKMNPKTNEPSFTNFTLKFQGAIDYIFYSGDALIVTRLLEPLDRKSAEKHTALPSPFWSSDHIAIMAEFVLNPHWCYERY